MNSSSQNPVVDKKLTQEANNRSRHNDDNVDKTPVTNDEILNILKSVDTMNYRTLYTLIKILSSYVTFCMKRKQIIN